MPDISSTPLARNAFDAQDAASIERDLAQRGGYLLHRGDDGEPTLSILTCRGEAVHLPVSVDDEYVTIRTIPSGKAVPRELAVRVGWPIPRSAFPTRMLEVLAQPVPAPSSAAPSASPSAMLAGFGVDPTDRFSALATRLLVW